MSLYYVGEFSNVLRGLVRLELNLLRDVQIKSPQEPRHSLLFLLLQTIVNLKLLKLMSVFFYTHPVVVQG